MGQARDEGARSFWTLFSMTCVQLGGADGREIDGMESLKDYLLTERREQFARAFVVKLLTYALGRSLEFSDEKHINALTKRFTQDKMKVQSLVQSIVKSGVFRTK